MKEFIMNRFRLAFIVLVIGQVLVDYGMADEVGFADLTGFDAIKSIAIASSEDLVYCAYRQKSAGKRRSSPI